MAAPVSTLTPEDIFVSGPLLIQYSVDGGENWEDLGMAPDDALPEYVERDSIHRVKTSSSGDASEQQVHRGITAGLMFTVVKYKAAAIVAIKARQRGGAANKAVVGTLLTATDVADSLTFGLRYIPTTTGRPGIEFARCWADGDSFHTSNLGNMETRLGINVEAIPDPATGYLYTILANS